MVLAVLVPLVGLLVVSTISVYLQPKIIVDILAKAYPEVVFSITTTEKIIALTIDDAPTHGDTPAILDILRDNDVRATFFCIGYNIIHEDPDREILTRMLDEGHELGNHMSYDTPSYQLNDTEFMNQLLEVDGLIADVQLNHSQHDEHDNNNKHYNGNNNNNSSKWFRPGHGFFTKKMVDQVGKHGYTMALGNVYPHDPAITFSTINSFYVLNRVHPGAVVILHNRPWTLDTLRYTLPKLKAMGYTITTLTELLKHDTAPRHNPLAIKSGK